MLTVYLAVRENSTLSEMPVGDFHIIRLAVMNPAVDGNIRIFAAMKHRHFLISGLRGQAPQAGNPIVAVMVNLDITGGDMKMIGSLPGFLREINSIAVQCQHGM